MTLPPEEKILVRKHTSVQRKCQHFMTATRMRCAIRACKEPRGCELTLVGLTGKPASPLTPEHFEASMGRRHINPFSASILRISLSKGKRDR